MIFATVGVSPHPFDRFVREMDRVAGKISEKVIIQTGSSNVKVKKCESVKYLLFDEFIQHIKNSRVVVGHCGAGTVLSAIKFKKPIVVVPRKREYNEIFDDNQIDFARGLEKIGFKVVYDIKHLENAIASINNTRIISDRRRLIRLIKSFIDEL